MTPRMQDRSLGDGVYYAPNDYVGFAPRLVILLVDGLFLAAMLSLSALLWSSTMGEYTTTFNLLTVAFIWLYTTPLKRSNLRTLGYRLMGCKLVSLKGTRPSLLLLTFRSLLWVFGPFNFLLDIIWCSIDDDRQTMR